MKLAINTGFVLGVLGIVIALTGPSEGLLIAGYISFGASTIALANDSRGK